MKFNGNVKDINGPRETPFRPEEVERQIKAATCPLNKKLKRFRDAKRNLRQNSLKSTEEANNLGQGLSWTSGSRSYNFKKLISIGFCSVSMSGVRYNFKQPNQVNYYPCFLFSPIYFPNSHKFLQFFDDMHEFLLFYVFWWMKVRNWANVWKNQKKMRQEDGKSKQMKMIL